MLRVPDRNAVSMRPWFLFSVWWKSWLQLNLFEGEDLDHGFVQL